MLSGVLGSLTWISRRAEPGNVPWLLFCFACQLRNLKHHHRKLVRLLTHLGPTRDSSCNQPLRVLHLDAAFCFNRPWSWCWYEQVQQTHNWRRQASVLKDDLKRTKGDAAHGISVQVRALTPKENAIVFWIELFTKICCVSYNRKMI